jgi:hypothetical protein
VGYVVKRTNAKNGEVNLLAGKRTEWPDDHSPHGSMLTDETEKAYRFPSYPDAMAAAGVLATQTGTEDFDYEVIE